MKSIVVGTAGHIDHGKSALVRALTGTDPDRLKEEKARGITIDLGFAHLLLDGINFAFVDVPGHERFVKNMLAGVGGIDLVLLVVAADESVMPQTREHFDICRLLRIPAGLIVLTKSDLVDADTIELVSLEVRELVAGSFLERAPILPVSSRTGAGLDGLRAALASAAATSPGRSSDGPARLPIDRVFSMKGFGTVVTGTLVSGRLRPDDELEELPRDRRIKVRGVQVHGARRDEAVAGQRTAINLAGVDVGEIERGATLATPGTFTATRIADAVIELIGTARPLRHGARVRFHQGTAEILGRVTIAGPIAGEDRGVASGSAGDGRVGRVVPAIQPGTRAFVRLRLEAPAVVTRGDRYIVRAYSPPLTIAGGYILDPHPQRGPIRTLAAIDRLRALDFDPGAPGDEPAIAAATVMIDESGLTGFPVSALVSRIAVKPSRVDAVVTALTSAHRAASIGELLVAPRVLDRLEKDIVAMLTAHHAAQPLSEGAPREEVRERTFAHGSAIVFDHVVEALTTAGKITGRDKLALATHRVALTPDEERARAAIERLLREGGLTPPDVATMTAQAGATSAVVDRVLKLLQRQKVLIRVDTLLFHNDALTRLKQEVTALKQGGGATTRIDVAMFKERFGVTRKYAIPLLEYLDRERVTRRVGDARVII